MKLAIFLIIIGAGLIVEGGFRAALGFYNGDVAVVVGGILTGFALGGFLLFKGIRRLRHGTV